MTFEAMNKRINELDKQIIPLLEQRLSLAKESGELKYREHRAVVDTTGELQLLARVANYVQEDDLISAVQSIYQMLVEVTQELEGISYQALENAQEKS